MTPRFALVVAHAALLVCFGAEPAFAHTLRMTVTLTATDITVKTSYSGDDHDSGPATVSISKLNKEVVVTGKIGPDGTWTTPKPAPGKYTVVAEDELGHRAENEIEVGQETEPKEWKANEPPLSSGLGVAIGIGVIGLVTLAAYWLLSHKKD
jgi:hypothetical protein